MLSRAAAMLLALAVLATVASSAQCVVRCIDPVTPPPCHHHAPTKQNPPAQACAAAMLPGESRAHSAPVAITPLAAPLEFTALSPVRVIVPEPLIPPTSPDPPSVLRI